MNGGLPRRPHVNCFAVPRIIEDFGGNVSKAPSKRVKLFVRRLEMLCTVLSQ